MTTPSDGIGAAWCAAHTTHVDEWLTGLLVAAGCDRPGVALVAVGGYGRSELRPASDIDVMLVRRAATCGRLPPLAPRTLAVLHGVSAAAAS